MNSFAILLIGSVVNVVNWRCHQCRDFTSFGHRSLHELTDLEYLPFRVGCRNFIGQIVLLLLVFSLSVARMALLNENKPFGFRMTEIGPLLRKPAVRCRSYAENEAVGMGDFRTEIKKQLPQRSAVSLLPLRSCPEAS
jgi:hypothetical protein